jgi:hypothetical protein
MTAWLGLQRQARLPNDRLRWAGRLVALVALVGLTAACGGSSSKSTAASSTSTSSTSSSSSTGTTTASRTWSIVALGDSVPSGYNCNCAPYPQLSASGLSKTTGQTITATNDAVAGYTTSNVLQQLSSDSTVIDQVKKADAVEINIGANDVPYNGKKCGTSVSCYAPLVAPMQKSLASIVSRVHDGPPGTRSSSCCSTTGASGSAAPMRASRATTTSARHGT